MQRPKTALITGGAGFIASNFVRHFLSTHPTGRVVVLDALTYAGNEQNLADLRDDARLTFLHGDICDRETVEHALQGCDWLLNFAAETHVDRSILSAGTFVRTDIEGTCTLLEAARVHGIERFVQISTDEVYGNAEAPDGTSRPSLETDTLNPRSPYAASKAGADRLAYAYWATYGLPVVITRCSNNYGPYQYPEKQLPLFIVNALADRPLPIYGSGSNTRDWIHVIDHCRALDMLLTALPALVNGEVFNIGASEERSVLDNARLVLDILGKPHDLLWFVRDRPGHVRRHVVDCSKLRDRVGWEPRIPFYPGIAETIEWYRLHHDWLSSILTCQDAFLQKALMLADESSMSSPSA